MVIVVINGIGDPSSNLDEAVCASLRANSFGKDMTPFVLLLSVINKYDNLGSLVLVRPLIEEKENIEFKPALLHLKIDLVSHSTHNGGVG